MKSFRVNNGKTVWFLRHGKTDFDYENCSYDEFIELLQNGEDFPLIEEDFGINFTELPQKVDLICHSPARRAVDTAEKLKEVLKVGKVELLEPLHEVKFNDSIMSREEFTTIKESRIPMLTRWFNNENKVESFEDSWERVKKIESFLHSRPEESILLVTHGWFLRLLDIYFVQGKQRDITLLDLLEVKPMALGEFVTANIF